MASSSYSLFLLTLSLLIFCYQPFLLVESDNALIQRVCSKTPEPSVCLECFQSHPSSKTADAKGLAVLSINCAEFDTDILFNFTFNLWQNTPNNNLPLKKILDECSANILLARDSYHGVVLDVQDNAFDAAKASIDNDVIAFVNRCMDQFNNKYPTVPVPQRILAGSHIVNQDCQVVLGILGTLR